MIIQKLSITLIVLFATMQPSYSMEEITHQFSQLDLTNETEQDFSLVEACKKGDFEVSLLLLEKKANPNVIDNQLKTPLAYCCESDNIPLKLVSKLLEYGADPNIQDATGATQLTLACFNDSEASNEQYIILAEKLFQKNANPNICDKYGNSPLLYSCAKNSQLSKLNLQFGANPNFQDHEGSTPLHYACGNTDTIELLLTFGANPLIQNKKNYIPLHFACAAQKIEEVKKLIEWPIALAGMHAEYRKSFFIFLCFHKRFSQITPHLRIPKPLLMILFIEGQPHALHKVWFNLNNPQTRALEIIAKMLSTEDEYGRTPLTIATEKNDLKIIKFLKKVEYQLKAEEFNQLTLFLKASQRKITIIKKKK
jgi:ankyrin repeat protein